MTAFADLVPVTRAEEANSGFAMIVEQYLEQSLEDSGERRRQASRLRGRMAMTAEDYNQAVTLVFEKQGITILEGQAPPLDASVTGPYQTLVELLQGGDSPLRAHLGGRVRVRSSLKKPFFPLHVHNLMKLEDEEQQEQAGVFAGVRDAAIAGAAIVAVVAALLYVT